MSQDFNKETTEEYLRRYAVLDGHGNMDGYMVPLSVAMLAVELTNSGRLLWKSPSWRDRKLVD